MVQLGSRWSTVAPEPSKVGRWHRLSCLICMAWRESIHTVGDVSVCRHLLPAVSCVPDPVVRERGGGGLLAGSGDLVGFRHSGGVLWLGVTGECLSRGGDCGDFHERCHCVLGWGLAETRALLSTDSASGLGGYCVATISPCPSAMGPQHAWADSNEESDDEQDVFPSQTEPRLLEYPESRTLSEPSTGQRNKTSVELWT